MSQELSGALPTLNMYYKKEITETVLKDSMKSMIMLAWGIFFSEMCDEADKFIDEESMEQEYQNFIEELHSYFPKDCDTFEKTLSNFTATSSLSMIEQLSGKIMQCVGFIMDSAIPDPIKEILKNKVVSGTMNITTGVGQIVAGAEMCATVVGTVGGIPMIVNGSNMAIMGVQDIWNVIHGKDEESVNLIKEALGHKCDNTVDLMELAITMGSAKKVSKVGQKAVSEAKNSLGKAFGKARKYASATGSEIREVSKSARSLCRKQIAKLRGPKYAVSSVPVNAEMLAEEFAKENKVFRKAVNPNIQLFAEKLEPILKEIHGEKRNIRVNVGRQEKHIPTKNNYENALKQGRKPSIFNGTAEDAQKLIDEFAGKGEMLKCGYKEKVNFGKIIGDCVNERTGIKTPTTWGKIHYSKDGVHIVPYLVD